MNYSLTEEQAFQKVADTMSVLGYYPDSDPYWVARCTFYENYGDKGVLDLDDEDNCDDATNALGAFEYHAKAIIRNLKTKMRGVP